jgi:signal transduction histidine kinase/ligand-binding sensor domain-containing protein
VLVLKSCAIACLLLALWSGLSQLQTFAGTNEPASEHYVIETWGVDEGLPHSTVASITQTPDGYLWLGIHHGGLARFDGVRFQQFNPVSTPALGSISIERLRVDSQGRLWIGSAEGGVTSFWNGEFQFEFQDGQALTGLLRTIVAADEQGVWAATTGGSLWHRRNGAATNRWTEFKVPDANERSVFCQDARRLIWYRTTQGWLGWFDGEHCSAVPTNSGLSTLQVNRLACDTSGRVWVGTERELAVWDGRRFQEMTPTNGEPVLTVRNLAIASDGSMWVRSDTQLRKCVGRQWVAEAKIADARLLALLPSSELEMQADTRGGLWLAHFEAGFWHVNAKGDVTRIGHDEGLPAGLMECWFQDREGNVWAGLTGRGLIKLSLGVFDTIRTQGEAFSKSATSVGEDSGGALWIGTADGGCFRWDGSRLEAHKPPNSPAMGHDVVVCPGWPSGVWVGLLNDGVWKYDRSAFSEPFPPAAFRGVVRTLYTDRSGDLWLGNYTGLFRWAGDRVKRFTTEDGFGRAYVVAITQDREGTIWCGTAGGELRCFRGGRFTTFRQTEAASATGPGQRRADSSGPPPFFGRERLWALHADREGPLWVGTLGGGLLRFQQGAFTRYLPRDGLPSEYVSQILEDDLGHLWLGTRAGIARVSKDALNRFAKGEIASLPCVTYGTSAGLPTVECSGGSQPAAWRAADGRLWFTTTKGVVFVRPERLPFNSLPPPVVIEEVRVTGEPLPLPRQNATAQAAEADLPRIKIPARRHYLQIRFTALSFTAPDQVRFRWRLEDWDEGWVEGGSQRVTSYSSLPPGDYVFRVTACNNDGVWSEAGAALAIRLLPSFWQTRWFQIGAVALSLATAAGAARFITVRKARRRLQEMERQHALERERARIAKDIHDDLGASLTHITMLTQSARQKLDDSSGANGDLTQIYGTARDLTRTMEEVVWAVSPKHDSLDSLATYLGTFAQDFAAASRLRCRLDLPANLSEQPLNSQVRHNLFLAFKEALHNVAKHAAATEVRVSLQVEAEDFLLTVEDNGRGFRSDAPAGPIVPPEGLAPRLLTGHGLANMRGRLEEIGGHCEIQSQFGLGTCVRFMVPLPANLSHK